MYRRALIPSLLSAIAAVLMCSVTVADVAGKTETREFDVYFIHQSTGDDWLNYGGLRREVNRAVTNDGHTFVMHDDWSGNSDHREWPDRFNHQSDWKKYDIVMFKSCFPASHIESKAMYKEYKRTYLKQMLKIFADNEDILFIIVTAPPLVPNDTNAAAAKRARKFNNWLKKKYLKKYNKKNPGLNNLAVYDYFNTLAADSGPEVNMLRQDYRNDEWDSHPNAKGHKQATEDFMPVLKNAADTFARSE
jgi:hypothetical protein